MAVEIDIDVGVLKSEIRKTYAEVSQQPGKDFIFPTGRAWAEELGYPDELARVPDSSAESFAGVANPFSLGRLKPGERVLDFGCGAGTDTLVAAGSLVDVYARSKFEDTRRKALKFGAYGMTVKAYKPAQ